MAEERGTASPPGQLHQYLAGERDRFLAELRELVRCPSDSASGEGMWECARILAARTQASGFSARILATEGHPLVYGEWPPRPGLPTLLLTSHYDVQPAGAPAEWLHPPYSATLEGDRLWGRGSSDAKGPVMAILKAAEGVLQAEGRPAVNLKVLFDGEEEIGSPSLPAAVERWRDLFRADAIVTFDGNSGPAGRPIIGFGGGGMLYVELRTRTGRHDLHANRGALVPNALWRLVWALASLKSPDEEVAIEGFYDKLVPPTEQERRLLESLPWRDDAELAAHGVDRFLPGRGGPGGPEALHLLPIVGLSGLQGGHLGTGVVTVLPGEASAKLYFGLRFAQDPQDIFRALRAHLDRRGFQDIQLLQLAATEPSSVRPDSALGLLARDLVESTFGLPPVVLPRANWYGRQGVWLANRLGADAAQICMIASHSSNCHAPNEHLLLEDFSRGIDYIGRLLLAAEGLPTKGP